MMDHRDAMKVAVEAQKFKTSRIEKAIQELDVSFVTVDVCGADANAVARYVRKLESALSLLRAALEAREEPVAAHALNATSVVDQKRANLSDNAAASPVAADTQGDALAAKLANGYTSGLFTSDFQGHKISLRYETRGAGEAAHAALCAAVDAAMKEQPSDGAAPTEAPSRPFGLDTALNMMRETKGGNECRLWTPLCWGVARYVDDLEAYAAGRLPCAKGPGGCVAGECGKEEKRG